MKKIFKPRTIKQVFLGENVKRVSSTHHKRGKAVLAHSARSCFCSCPCICGPHHMGVISGWDSGRSSGNNSKN